MGVTLVSHYLLKGLRRQFAMKVSRLQTKCRRWGSRRVVKMNAVDAAGGNAKLTCGRSKARGSIPRIRTLQAAINGGPRKTPHQGWK